MPTCASARSLSASPIEHELRRQSEAIKAEVAENKQKVLAAGGLYIIGTERHESRRIDNQLRGRSGRQGDPGASKFFLSLQDDLMRIFGSERMDAILTRLGLEPGEAITHPWVNKALEKAQQKVEARNFEIRKNILKYDNVLNDQRRVIFEQRKEIMSSDDVSDQIADFREEVVEMLVSRHIPEKAYAEQWDAAGLEDEVGGIFGVQLPVKDWAKEEGIADEEVRERILKAVDERAAARTAEYGPEVMRYVEKAILLQTLDHDWREHIVDLDHLRQYVGLRGYGQRDPLNEYKSDAFELFENLLGKLRAEVVRQLMHVQIQTGPVPPLEKTPLPAMQATHLDPLTGENEVEQAAGMWDDAAGGPQQSQDLGAGLPQCAVSLWLWPQVQTLPRGVGLSFTCAKCRFRALCAEGLGFYYGRAA